jgi:hypothetical protein
MPETKDAESFSWTSFPAAENKPKALLVGLFLIVLFAFIYVSFGTMWLAVSLLLLGSSVAPFYAVTRYRMTDEEVEAFHFFHTVRKPWSSFNSYYEDRRGVLLSPFDRPSRLENYRGLYLRFGGRRQEVMGFVKKKINT